MSKKQLPVAPAGRPCARVTCETLPSALDRWNGGIKAAATDDNSISVFDVIGQDYWGEGVTAKRIAGALRAMNGADVTVNINSPGGDMFEGLAIYNLLREYQGKVTVKVLGIAASAASVIAMAGDDIQIGRGAFLMIHNCWVVAMGMQKDSRGAMLKVLDSLAKVPKAKQAAVMNALFGKESLSAIAPLLTNLDLLRTNFDRVADAQEYGGSMQKEYASRAATTENQLVLLKNSVNAISVTLGDTFLPAINEAAEAVMPYLEQLRTFVRANPELVQSAAKFGAALLAVGVSIGSLSRAVKILNSVINLSPAKVAIAALVAGAMLIIENWDDVAPVIRAVWQEVDNVAQEMGGWETVIEGVGLVMAGSFTVRTIGALQQSVLLAGRLSGLLGKIGRMGAMTLTIGVAVSLFKELKDLEQGAKDAGMDAGAFAVQKLQTKERERGYNGFIPRLKELLGMDTPIPQGRYQPYVPLTRRSGVLERAVPPSTQRSELKVTFENAPQGMRVTDIPKSGNPLMNISHDVGYSPFRTSR
ncbi:phage tail tape measure protein [Salmonella enterica]|nr:phage tail tape measure protein [Salmonella enterica]